MNKKKIKVGSFLYKMYLYYNLYFHEKIFIKRKTYSQFREDIFIKKIFYNFDKGKYVDIGAFHPTKYNNTALLYNMGWSGINIDVNPTTKHLFDIARPADVNITQAISDKNNYLSLYFEHAFSPINSLDKKNLNYFNIKNIKSFKVRTKKFLNIIKNPFNFLNIDCEGHDYRVLKTIDLAFYKPDLVCIEILKNCCDKKKIFLYFDKYNYKFTKKIKDSFFFKKIRYN
jgi:hypothetical protein